MRKALAVVTILAAAAAGCASRRAQDEDVPQAEPAHVGQVAQVPDARIAQLQQSMTELLERIDVLNDRIARLESAAADRTASPQAAAVAEASTPHRASAPRANASLPAAVAGAQLAEHYREALTLFGKGKNVEARAAFQKVFDADPTGELADNALYWIGGTWLSAGNTPEAIRYFKRVVAEYADQNKAPDAMYKLGVTYARTGDLALARSTLEECMRKYPYSSAAASAKAELARIQY